jgi:CheY-like chemotaxis protein
MEALFERRPQMRLVIAETGQEALLVAEGLSPQLLLLDLQLPECHGSELLPLLRRLPGCSLAPAVAVTANSDFDIGGTGFLELWPKPMNLDWVLERLDHLLSSASGPDDSEQPSSYRAPGGSLSRMVGV